MFSFWILIASVALLFQSFVFPSLIAWSWLFWFNFFFLRSLLFEFKSLVEVNLDTILHVVSFSVAQALYQAGEKVLGTDESKFNQILCSQGYDQLRLVFAEYRKLANKGIDQSIRSEMSGNLESGMLAIGEPASFVIKTNYLYCCLRLTVQVFSQQSLFSIL